MQCRKEQYFEIEGIIKIRKTN